MEKYISQVKENLKRMKSVTIPPALMRLKTQRLMVSIVIIFLSIVAAIILKNIGMLVGLIVGLYMLFAAFKTDYEFANNKIKEYELVCISAFKRRYGTTIILDIVFCDDDGATYKFNYADKKGVFYENLRYKLYVDENNPEYIITYQQM